jgi:hypothetical protein
MRYRQHKGSLADSMATECEVDGRDGLIRQLRREFRNWPTIEFPDDAVRIEPYHCDDDRIGWKDVHIVTIDGYGVAGFCEGPL